MDSKAEYSASSTLSQKKETKTNKRQCPFNSVQFQIHEGSPEEIVIKSRVMDYNTDNLRRCS